jgi:hypothetical protein
MLNEAGSKLQPVKPHEKEDRALSKHPGIYNCSLRNLRLDFPLKSHHLVFRAEVAKLRIRKEERTPRSKVVNDTSYFENFSIEQDGRKLSSQSTRRLIWIMKTIRCMISERMDRYRGLMISWKQGVAYRELYACFPTDEWLNLANRTRKLIVLG